MGPPQVVQKRLPVVTTAPHRAHFTPATACCCDAGPAEAVEFVEGLTWLCVAALSVWPHRVQNCLPTGTAALQFEHGVEAEAFVCGLACDIAGGAAADNLTLAPHFVQNDLLALSAEPH